MTWNYRVICRVHQGETFYAIHEVFYDKKGKPGSVTQEPSYPQGETKNELRRDFRHYQQALTRPILEYDDF